MSVDAIVAAVRSRAFRFTSEVELQEQLANAFKDDGIVLCREWKLSPKDRPDFGSTDGVAVEVKIKGTAAAVLMQLHRYACSEHVTSIVLITSVARHVGAMPGTLNGKPVCVVMVGGMF